MNARVKAVTIWSALGGACVLASVLLLTGRAATSQTSGAPALAERLSVRSDGGEANGASSGAVTGGDGTCVAFYSDATNFFPRSSPDADTNGVRDVFLFNRSTLELRRVSVTHEGRQANGPSQAQGFLPAIDANCSCVAFSSDATNLVEGDTNRRTDVFVRDLAAEPPTTLRVSVGDGQEANGSSSFPGMSADCQRVVFQSIASNLVPDDTNNKSDIFVYDRGTGVTTRVSVGTGGEEANGASITPAISADGRCVAFASSASNLFPGDTNGKMDVYVACDGVVSCRASVGSAGNEANDISFLPALSADGRLVAFKSMASNLVPNDRNHAADVFVHDCETGQTERVSVNARGEEANDNSIPPTISGDGRFVAFGSFASNLVVGQTARGRSQIYVRDRQFGVTSLVSSNPAGLPGNNGVPDIPPSISQDGDFVAFASLASDLVAGDTNNVADVYIRRNVVVPPTPTPTPTPPPTCRTDADCPEPLVCDDNVCRFPCQEDADCPEPLVCDDNVCRVPCADDNDCPPGQRCVNDVCRAPCEQDDDCPAGQVCVGNVCQRRTPTPTATPTRTPIPCFFDQDCPLGQVCDEGKCRAIPCESDEDCPGGRLCVDGLCQPIPVTPPPLPTCTTDADCVIECSESEDCPPGRTCEEAQCDPADRCRAMVCVPPRPCDDEDPILDRFNCRGERETCVNNACECVGDCNLDGLVFGNEVSRMVCILGGSEDCPLSSCLAGDTNQDGEIVGSEVCTAVTNLGLGCPGEGLPLEFRQDRSTDRRRLEIGSATGVRGETVTIGVDLSAGEDVATAQMDLIFDTAVLSIPDPETACTVAPGLTATHKSFTFLPQQPGTAPGKGRLRLFVGDLTLCQEDLQSPVRSFSAGPLLSCTFQIRPNAPIGTFPLVGERLNIGDARGNEFGVVSVAGSVTVACSASSECGADLRQACVEGRCQCVGDCNGDGLILSDEVTLLTNILRGETPVSACPSADVNGDDLILSNEVTLVVINLREGCPGGAAAAGGP